MKFVCDGMILSDAALTVSKACAAKTITPVLECIKLRAENDTLTLTAYDGEISIEKRITAEILEEGELCALILVDDGERRARHVTLIAKTLRKTAGEGGFSHAQSALVGDHVTGGEALCQTHGKGFRLRRGMCKEFQRKSPFREFRFS